MASTREPLHLDALSKCDMIQIVYWQRFKLGVSAEVCTQDIYGGIRKVAGKWYVVLGRGDDQELIATHDIDRIALVRPGRRTMRLLADVIAEAEIDRLFGE